MITIDGGMQNSLTEFGPHGGVLVLRNKTTETFYFKTIERDGEVLVEAPTEASLRSDLSTTHHALRSGESIFVRTGEIDLDPKRVNRIVEFVRTLYDLGMRNGSSILQLFGDSGGEIQDSAWLTQRRGDPYRPKPLKQEGWHEPYALVDGDGHANNRYNHIMHSIAWATFKPTTRNIQYALNIGWGAMCFGFYTLGSWTGRMRPEKGTGAYGYNNWGSPGNPTWSKTHIESLIVMEALTGHPYLTWLLDEAAYSFEEVGPFWWDGKYGARGPARWLDGLVALGKAGHNFHLDPQSVVDHIMDFYNPEEKLWVNGISLRDTSPWMNLQLIRSLHRYCDHHGLDLPEEVTECYTNILATYTTADGGVFYRCAGDEARVQYRTSSAWLAGCAHQLGDVRTMTRAEDYQRWPHGVHVTGSYGSNVIKDFVIWAMSMARNYEAFEILDA